MTRGSRAVTDHNISTELLPCPFCGSEGQLVCEGDYATVACSHYYCNFSQIALRDKGRAVARWNRRALPTASDAVGTAENPCPRCHYNAGPEGAERYWEARWRDEKAENERLQRLADERLDSATIEACAKIAEGTAPIAAGNFFAARRDQCAIIATKIRALKIADERAKELATLRGEPCPGCDGHECDDGCQYPGASPSPQPVTKASHDVGTQEER